MSTSGSDSDDSSTSENSDVSQIYDYEQEIEEEDSPSDNTRGENSAVVPYDEEPIADEAWVQNYKKKQELEGIRVDALQERLDGKVPITLW